MLLALLLSLWALPGHAQVRGLAALPAPPMTGALPELAAPPSPGEFALEAISLPAAPEAPVAASELDAAETRAIDAYTAKDYEGINSFLRTGRVPAGWKDRRQALKKVGTLSRALQKIPSVDGSFFRYIDVGGRMKKMPGRFPWFEGVVLDFKKIDKLLAAFEPGQTYADRAFLSTTSNDTPSGKFGYTTLQLRIQGHSAKPVDSYTAYPEAELIFQPGTRFRVKDMRGEFVDYNSTNPGEYPDLDQWQAFVRHYQSIFPGVDDADVQAEFATKGRLSKIPNLIIELEEIP